MRFLRLVVGFMILVLSGLGGYWVMGYYFGESQVAVETTDYQKIEPVETARDEGDSEITILVVGDVMLGRSVNSIAHSRDDFSWVFGDMRVWEFLSEADMVIGNLESPLVRDCKIVNDGFIFCADIRWAKTLGQVFDVMSVANNHALNYSIAGLEDTIYSLEEEGVLVAGVREEVVSSVGDKRIGVLAYNDVGRFEGINNYEEVKLVNEVNRVSNQVDFLIVYFHWGEEYVAKASPRQEEIARLSIDSGADLVVGAHPHWVQNIEVYKEKLIVYSLGNFVFDQMWSEETRKGQALVYTIGDTERYSFVDTYIVEYGKVTIP